MQAKTHPILDRCVIDMTTDYIWNPKQHFYKMTDLRWTYGSWKFSMSKFQNVKLQHSAHVSTPKSTSFFRTANSLREIIRYNVALIVFAIGLNHSYIHDKYEARLIPLDCLCSQRGRLQCSVSWILMWNHGFYEPCAVFSVPNSSTWVDWETGRMCMVQLINYKLVTGIPFP